MNKIDGNLVPKGYVQMTSLATALPLPLVPGARIALLQAETKDIRWRDDATDPTAAVGIVLAAGSSYWYIGDVSKVRVIEVTASAKLNIVYYG